MTPADKTAIAGEGREFVTFTIASALFGAEVSEVNDVFALQQLTPVPRARADVAGLLNLRGRIVTALDARRRLGLPDRARGVQGLMAIGVERDGESFGIIVDSVGEVLRLKPEQFEEPPQSLDEAWRDLARGVYRLDQGLLIAIDIHRMLDWQNASLAHAA